MVKLKCPKTQYALFEGATVNSKIPFALLVFLTSLLAPSLLISPVYAIEQVDISEVPQRLAEALNIPLFAGQVLTSTILMCLTLFPALLLTRSRGANQEYTTLFVGFLSLSTCVAIGWLPYWILLLIALIVASLYASKIAKVFGGT